MKRAKRKTANRPALVRGQCAACDQWAMLKGGVCPKCGSNQEGREA